MKKDADLDLNHSANLPDHTAQANKAEPPHHAEVSATDLKRGFTLPAIEKTSPFDPDITGENQVGDPYSAGGFLGRPRGNAR